MLELLAQHNGRLRVDWAVGVGKSFKIYESNFGLTFSVFADINGYLSFFVAPDGSKEGWSESQNGDEAREKLTLWLDAEK